MAIVATAFGEEVLESYGETARCISPKLICGDWDEAVEVFSIKYVEYVDVNGTYRLWEELRWGRRA